MNYRNRKLLDLAHKVTVCQSCGGHTEGCVPAHSNWSAIGNKGAGIKADDWAVAALCHPCHMVLDQGRALTREQRQEMWQRAFYKTMKLYFENGWLEVK